ncbi:MAG: HAMP domain-containing sensor histidine kinase, partial [bacterium]|nr:HAMP domain-containing sensor histidine kinase [bacterium]
KGIYLKLEKPENPFAISADKEKIKSAIFNVISNAVKYTPKGGVTINIKKADIKQILNSDNQNQNTKPAVIIEVKDTGIGIPQDKVKNIFEEQFKRTEQAKKTAEGSGVGLYLSGQIIKLHKGRAWAESEGEGKGSTFYIELPVS